MDFHNWYTTVNEQRNIWLLFVFWQAMIAAVSARFIAESPCVSLTLILADIYPMVSV